jgi:hypothetical protein
MITRIHVNQHIIKSNQTAGHRTPPLTVKNYKANIKAREVFIAGPCRVVYRPDKPLACGARVWIETAGKVLVDDEIPPPARKLVAGRSKCRKRAKCGA